MKELVYLASPYSHPDPSIERRRFEQVCRTAAVLMAEGTLIFSPIAHSHSISVMGALPGDFAYWESFDRAILSVCRLLVVLKLHGWEGSAGIAAEMQIARELGIPIAFLDPPKDNE